MVDLKGLHKVRSKGRVYVYAWRGGPRLLCEPGTPEFTRELADALASRTSPNKTKIAGLCAMYRASDEWKELSDKTRASWRLWLDRIQDEFGKMSIAAFDRPLIRVAIRKWRDHYKATPRAADMGLQVLSRLLSFGMAEGKLQNNACAGIPRLYDADRSGIIWLEEDLQALAKIASKEVMWAARLAALTGLRQGDLLRLSWNHISDLSIEIRTGKSRRKPKTTLIPLYGELRQLLAEIPKRGPMVLTTTKGRPWKSGFGSSWQDDVQKAGIDKHFHDLRGTAATKMYLAGLTVREIAVMFTWSETYVEELINRYVKKDELLRDRIRRIDEARVKRADEG